MAIRYAIEKHTSAFPTKVLAAEGGKHIYNVRVTSDTDNGWFIGRGEMIAFDEYEEVAATNFEGKICPMKAANGNFYVEVVNPGDALFVYTVPVIAEDYSHKFTAESNFFNEEGATVKAYELAVGDIVEISAEGFEGEPVVNAQINGISGKKLVVA